jgi:hypothetical protein
VLLACVLLTGALAAPTSTGSMPVMAAPHGVAAASITPPPSRMPSTPCPDTAPGEGAAALETLTDAAPVPGALPAGSYRTPWVAVVPLWPSDALQWQRLDPSLRLNPGHAPPTV